MVRANRARCWPLPTRPLGVLLARRAQSLVVEVGYEGGEGEEEVGGCSSAGLLLQPFSWRSLPLSAHSVLWRVEWPRSAGSPFAQGTGQLQSQLRAAIFIQGPLIIQALIIFCCYSSFCGFALPRIVE